MTSQPDQPTAIVIIPARGGSKSIPLKNIKDLGGKPLIARTIEAALNANTVGRVIVSTDHTDIERVARQHGAEVMLRPKEISGDLTPSEDAVLHVLEELRDAGESLPQVTAFLQCTAPLMLPSDIDGTVSLVGNGGYDSALTTTDFHYFVWEDTEDGSMKGVNHSGIQRQMRQERSPQYLEVGAVYTMNTKKFLQERFRFFGKIGSYPIPEWRAFEIDEASDWQAAEALVALLDTSATPGN